MTSWLENSIHIRRTPGIEKLEFVKLMHCSKWSLMGNQLICSNLFRPIYIAPTIQIQKKFIHLFWNVCNFVFRLRYQAKHTQSKWGCINALHKILPRDKSMFPVQKPEPFHDFFITFKAIDSPHTDRFQSSAQSRYVIWWYYLISMCHVISRLHSRFRLFLVPNSILFVMSFWMPSFLSYWLTNYGDFFKKSFYEFFYLSHNINV